MQRNFTVNLLKQHRMTIHVIFLKYMIYRGRGAAIEDQIEILEEYNQKEYTEKYAYELAKLYYRAGQKEKCVDACDDLVVWFRQGKYVIRALELETEDQKH